MKLTEVTRPPKRSLITACAAMTALALLAGCSSSKKTASTSTSNAGTTGTSSSAAAPSTGGSSSGAGGDAVQTLAHQAFLSSDVSLSSLPQTVQDTFTAAAQPLTQAQLDTAYKCWQASTCDTGSGGSRTLGIADGFGDNTWRKFTKMEIILQALHSKDIGKIVYVNAHGELAQMQTNVRSLTAQGIKAIVTYDDFGSAMVPGYAAAQRSGAKISSFVGGIPGAPTSAVANQVSADICAAGKSMADSAIQVTGGSGPIAFFNGTTGNPQGVAWNKCAEDELKAKGGGVTVAYKADTSWTPAGAFSAASGLVSSGKQVKAILYDYADPVPQIIKAFEQAGKVTPAIITWTSNNGLNGQWEQRQGTPKAFPLYYTNGLNWEGRVSVTAVLDLLAGKSVPGQLTVPMPFVQAKKGDYISSQPADSPGPSALIPPALIAKMLG